MWWWAVCLWFTGISSLTSEIRYCLKLCLIRPFLFCRPKRRLWWKAMDTIKSDKSPSSERVEAVEVNSGLPMGVEENEAINIEASSRKIEVSTSFSLWKAPRLDTSASRISPSRTSQRFPVCQAMVLRPTPNPISMNQRSRRRLQLQCPIKKSPSADEILVVLTIDQVSAWTNTRLASIVLTCRIFFWLDVKPTESDNEIVQQYLLLAMFNTSSVRLDGARTPANGYRKTPARRNVISNWKCEINKSSTKIRILSVFRNGISSFKSSERW